MPASAAIVVGELHGRGDHQLPVAGGGEHRPIHRQPRQLGVAQLEHQRSGDPVRLDQRHPTRHRRLGVGALRTGEQVRRQVDSLR
ncbi:hypothetical protein [Micromonospora robiginosa]|uniref:Uncharacterized protein n=1 Tax=Micromonospora robiginosa TaxID=2749844 RepID=A0A7L6BDZ1_9ACTN|nr:hypothetical protein [Micromonospora ferruginea]QLQ40137.1 hypothetical protein H1D33_15775 [Micromonospora ferruginea]